jgi:hypothetical protein
MTNKQWVNGISKWSSASTILTLCLLSTAQGLYMVGKSCYQLIGDARQPPTDHILQQLAHAGA